MKKVITVVGARPQFIKAAVISRLIKGEFSDRFLEFLVHTGQHYDENMSDVFFNEMHIPRPDVNLEIGGKSHGAMTGQMLEKIENVLLEQKPDIVLVYGDTNSTLAGALAASKLHIPVAHVEAGLRSFNKLMPEEQNRILTDHLSTWLFCPTETAVKNLEKEGVTKGVVRTGDIMLDASLFYRSLPHEFNYKIPNRFYLVTLHRAENTDSKEKLSEIVAALNEYKDVPAVLPLHPRTQKMMQNFNLKFADHIQILPPVGYLDMLYLEAHCEFIVTDSGGVQKEAYFFKKPCITLRDQTEWVETVTKKANALCISSKEAIISQLNNIFPLSNWPSLYGSGITGHEILAQLSK